MRRSSVDHARASPGRIASIFPALLLSGLILICPRGVEAQTWNGSVSDLWSNASNWTPNTVPNSSSASATVTNATNNPVLIDIAPTIANLTVGGSNSVSLNNAESLTIAGGAGAGSLDIAGSLTIGSTGSFTDMILGGTSGSTITLSGGGTLSLSDSPNNRVFSTTGDTLVNSAGNTIQGSGQFGINNAGFAFTLNNAGIINANQSNALQVAPTNTVTNTGTIEATGGGTLLLIAPVTNTSGLIQATGAGSVVEINGSTITGGTITTSGGGTVQNSGTATLNGVSISSGSTFTAVNASSTTLQGTINLAPTATLLQNSTGSFTDLHISGTVELAGGGTLAMSSSPNNRIFATGSDTLINDVNNTIQGAGQLGINNSGFAFTLNNAGTINANSSGNTLQVAPTNTVTNTGLMEATNGGTLALIGTFTNTGGTILATGASSIVELNGSTITGGILTTSGGGTVQNSGTATLDGVTVSSGSTVTAVNASSTTLQNTITLYPSAVLAQNSTGSFTDIHISGTVELAGGGTLAMSNSFNNRIFASGSDTLINDASNTIQGSGQLGINNGGFAFTLTNKGTIDANRSAPLQVAPNNPVSNSGTLEATAGGTLLLTGGTFNNTASGVILATGPNSVVDFAGSTITGGTLTTSSGGTIQNSSIATLDGTTNSPMISTGSTVSLLNGTYTTLLGTIINNGTIAQNSTGSFTDLHISGNVTLTGTGVLALSDSPNNRIFATGSDSLTNDVNHTIQGSGQLGINNAGFGFTLINNGTILANQSNALNIAPSGNTTNNGTFQANSGSTLFMNGTLTNYDPVTSTITGGSYNAFSGTIQLSQANTGTGAVIATNAATILLDGASAKIADGSGNNILQGFFTTNTAAGSFTIQNGANLTSSSSDFSNAGTMNIGANSTFTVGGSHDYVQTGGTTTLGATTSFLAVASGHSVDIGGGTLQGFGTITGNLSNTGGTIMPGTPGVTGILTVTGNYSDPPSSQLFIQIGGPNPGTGFSQLDIAGTASLGGMLDVSLINGFTPFNGEQFVILTSSGLSGSFLDNTIHDGNVTFTVAYSPSGFPNDVVLDASVSSPVVPEPASWLMLGLGLTAVGSGVVRKSRANEAPPS